MITVEPRYFEVPREMEKKEFKIEGGFRNNRGSVKFVNKNRTVWRKTPINYKYSNYMSDKSADAVVLKNLWTQHKLK